MITKYTRAGLHSGDDFCLRDENDKVIMNFVNMQRIGGRKYIVSDDNEIPKYIISETDVETKNEYTIYDDKSNEIIIIKRTKSMFGSKIKIKYDDSNYKFGYTLLPKLKILMHENDEIVVSAELKNAEYEGESQMVLEAEFSESDHLVLNLVLFSALGILYTDTY